MALCALPLFVADVLHYATTIHANLSIHGSSPFSVDYNMLDPRRKEVSVNLVKKLCDGLDMTLGEFFSAAVFDELEQEIQ